ncbi:hypothetical protein N692_11470 [Lactiplantibacillus plantarum EGD-AQ4]|nr:hypothetical protein N692_11470 [Lactiplantibacillus plantarum EGD-AQ4]
MELVDPFYTEDGNNILMNVNVKYLDSLSKVTRFFQYKLRLKKNGTWVITELKYKKNVLL